MRKTSQFWRRWQVPGRQSTIFRNTEFELRCFPDGGHGLALADGNNDLSESIPHLAHWSELCAEWLEKYI